ncbi:hypothetical protein [Ureibacillus chungkukjangi]|uniref:Uncharacterized protein n=1 Tax=Ureibacillus chungkukjangi TaxID=1202712 RepID=A0A318TUV1_9BACL|nr:hypothetical protein [Ureibacillus chungkukjangi]PYF08444.1 hypothetical protein BJ095_102210 [Ureibacillus chungkukjangi]
MLFFIFISFYFTPILAIIFCLNLVAILKKIKSEQPTAKNTFWLTTSFVLMAWSIAFSSYGGL